MVARTLFGLCLCSMAVHLALESSCSADVVVSTFEEPALEPNLLLNGNSAFEGFPATASQFRSGAVTFNNSGVFFGGTYWSGFGYSRRTAPGAGEELYDSSNDLIAKPAIGAGGSATWAIVGDSGVMTADVGYRFSTLNLTSTLYSWTTMANGDRFAGPPLQDGGGTGRFTGQDDFFTVRFTNTATSAFLDFNLADYRGATDYIHSTWQSFNLAPLAASQISIGFLASRETNVVPPPDPPLYFIDIPAYVALDNISVASITAVPEPSSLGLLAASAATGLWIRWRRRRPGMASPSNSPFGADD